MKYFFRTLIFLIIGIFLIACGQSLAAAPSPLPSPSETLIPTFTFVPTQTPTATIQPTPRPTYARPTLIPTIDPTLLPNLLKDAFSIQVIDDVNGHKMRQITGWDYGFGGGYIYGSCSGYYWLDTNHLLLYPSAGQVRGPEGYWGGINVVPQPVVFNLENGRSWLPPVNMPSPTCNRVYWSRELGILITSSTENNISTVFTYNFDGLKLSSYPGKILDISPSRTKILVSEDTLVDLRTNKTTKLNWSLENYDEQMLSNLFWTSDETRIYRCCYFYADLAKGISYHFSKSDFINRQGERIDYDGLWLYRGVWIQNDTNLFFWWSYIDDGDIRYLPIINPATRTIFDLRTIAGISPDLECPETNISPNGKYLWIMCYEINYLVDLSSFETESYPEYSQVEINWATDDKFAVLQNYDSSNKTEQYYLLSTFDKELKSLAINGLAYFWDMQWHPSDHVFAYIPKESQKLVLFNADNMTAEELTSPIMFKSFSWSPNGNYIALAAEDGSVWQVDYPKLVSLEQLTLPVFGASGVSWSPDGNSVTFISNSDVYIVDALK